MLINFMNGKSGLSSMEEARGVIEGFGQMTDMAVEDYHNDVSVCLFHSRDRICSYITGHLILQNLARI